LKVVIEEGDREEGSVDLGRCSIWAIIASVKVFRTFLEKHGKAKGPSPGKNRAKRGCTGESLKNAHEGGRRRQGVGWGEEP